MSWQKWAYGNGEADIGDIERKIATLMRETALEMPFPGLDEWYDAGIEIENSPYGAEAVLVYCELQETEWTDIDGRMKVGCTLTLQLEDGQQETETFFADEREQWPGIAEYFARLVALNSGDY